MRGVGMSSRAFQEGVFLADTRQLHGGLPVEFQRREGFPLQLLNLLLQGGNLFGLLLAHVHQAPLLHHHPRFCLFNVVC